MSIKFAVVVDSSSSFKIYLGSRGGIQCMPHVSGCLWRPEENIGFPGCGLTDSCELPGVSSGRPVPVF